MKVKKIKQNNSVNRLLIVNINSYSTMHQDLLKISVQEQQVKKLKESTSFH